MPKTLKIFAHLRDFKDMRPYSLTAILSFPALWKTASASDSIRESSDSNLPGRIKVERAHESSVILQEKELSSEFRTIQPFSLVPFSQSLQSGKRIDFETLCIGKNGWDKAGKYWRHLYKDAQCLPQSGDPRLFKLTCSKAFRINDQANAEHSLPDVTFHVDCPIDTTCQTVFGINPREGGPLERAGCVEENDLVQETVHSDPTRTIQFIHCGLPLQLPGPHYRAVPGQQKIDVVLTEQVQYLNGSAYPAPLISIRDTTNTKPVDRVLKYNTNGASALIELGTYRGKFASKTFEFCVQMLPGHVISSVIFRYSFFTVDLHHGRIVRRLKPVSND